MLIRPSMLVRGAEAIAPYKDFTDFTKLFTLIESTVNTGEGYTIYEMSLIIFPEEKDVMEAPFPQAVQKVNELRNRIRHHPVNTMMVPYSVIQSIQDENGKWHRVWVTLNIKDHKEWDGVKLRMGKIIDGYRRNMRKFGKIVDLGMVERRRRAMEYVKQITAPTPTPKVRKKKKSS